MSIFSRLRGEGPSRLAVIGIAGVPYQLLRNHADRFDSLDRLLDAGSGGPMASVPPPDTNLVWASMMSGCNPGETGVYGIVDCEVDSYSTYVTSGQDVQTERIWDRATSAGMDVSLVNVPLTHPPQRNLQRVIAGHLTPDLSRGVHPQSLEQELTRLGYRIDTDSILARDGRVEEFIEDAHETLDSRHEAISYIIDLDDWDLFMGVFLTPDRVNHFLYGDYVRGGPTREEFLAFYEQLDTYIGTIRSRLPDDVPLMVVSDHGFGPLKYEVEANAWLAETGWLSYSTSEADALADIEPSSEAFSLAPGRFYLNLAGREPAGTVPEEEYEVVRERLRTDLLEWTDPRGNLVVDDVYRRESIYRGPHLDLAPDLIALPADGFELGASFSSTTPVFGQSSRTGTHRVSDASFFLDIPGVTVDDATIYDIAPTVLRLLDISFEREEFDGVSLL